MNVEQYLNAVDEVSSLSIKPSLSTREVQRQNALLAVISASKNLFSTEEIKRATRDRVLKEAGLPREPEKIRRRVSAEVDREYRLAGLGKNPRLTVVPDDLESRANLAGTESIAYTQPAAGGKFVPFGMFGRFLESAKHADDIFQDWAHFPIETETGNSMSVPSADDVSVQSSQITEGNLGTESDIANFGTLTLNAWSFRSHRVLVSIELLQDSNFPIADVLETVFAKRHARGIGQALINGSGVNQPTGLVTGALSSGANVTIAAGSSANDGSSSTGSNSIGTDDFKNCLAGLDPAYWQGALWAMNPSTLLSLWGQRDKQGRPLINDLMSPGGMMNTTPYIMGKRVAVCPSMDKIGATKNSVVLYHPDYFLVRNVPSSMYVRVFTQTPGYIENGLIGFESFYRVDSALSSPNPSFAPVSVIQNHS